MNQSTRISLTPNKLSTETDRKNHGNPPQVIALPDGLAGVPRARKTLRAASRGSRERDNLLRRPRGGPASGKNHSGGLAGVPRTGKTTPPASRGSREREKPLRRPRGRPASGKNSPGSLAGGPRGPATGCGHHTGRASAAPRAGRRRRQEGPPGRNLHRPLIPSLHRAAEMKEGHIALM